MPREIVLGNGGMLLNFDASASLRDLYFPFVGMENHVVGRKCRLGIWVEGCFRWLDDDQWIKSISYRPGTLVSDFHGLHPDLPVEVGICDAVYHRRNILLRTIKLKNRTKRPLEVRVFAHNNFYLGGNDIGDTASYHPGLGAMIHFKREHYLLISGSSLDGGIWQYHVQKRFGGEEGSSRDAEDGLLSGNPVDQGSVDSTISFRVNLDTGAGEDLTMWICAGESLDEVTEMSDLILERGVSRLTRETERYWHHWLYATGIPFEELSEELAEALKRSLLVTRTQIDNGGAILAANDTDILETNRDHYSYVWPRDGALVAYALDLAGCHDITAAYFRFSERTLEPGGYFLHKYLPNGMVGSTWHPILADHGGTQLPIQEDETGLVLWALWQHYLVAGDFEFVADLYETLIAPAAEFMVSYRNPQSGLPLDSFDLWEERRGVFSFTTAAVCAGLEAAASFAAIFGDDAFSSRWRQAAGEVRAAMVRYLFDEGRGRFLRGLFTSPNGEYLPDYTLDASLYGIYRFGVFPPGDRRVEQTMRAVAEGLWVQTDVGGIGRYTNDYYFKRSDDIERVPGNPWIICTLWVADWYLEQAENKADLEKALRLIEWAKCHQLPTGVFSEQIHPYTGEPLSVAPLTWSHATFIQVVLHYLQKRKTLPEACL
ncbi:MAG: glycoside hydrolase family 15 protein [Eubacteriales bacterium]|nr:glycoside hydrolase family 15 protein [Bacillota bacterium]MBV1727293.1 glycoside hydrolase family 15 protein [Desulforudis sp.]MDP3050949.1 glycoside hydrolase family 15 protein [Eubacteriales bacterium]MBV1735725.1 glycoside hydrolase family 15 protein [Desulforudis sp.]MDP3045145.1 glycoside hydrolase family 15 protein [Bacillota bacterium]